eukprot:COSAG04_NODE_20261_length_397_cov_0.872483_2_plen_63_part_01
MLVVTLLMMADNGGTCRSLLLMLVMCSTRSTSRQLSTSTLPTYVHHKPSHPPQEFVALSLTWL